MSELPQQTETSGSRNTQDHLNPGPLSAERSPSNAHLPAPAGHTIPDTSQDAVGLLGHLGTMLALVQLAVACILALARSEQALQPLPFSGREQMGGHYSQSCSQV